MQKFKAIVWNTDNEAWRAAVHKGHKMSDMIERLIT